MTIQEILAAHRALANAPDDTVCACDRTWRTNTAYRAHLAEVLDKHMQEREAAAWHEAKSAIRNIPCWFKDWDHHGFDLWTDENGYAQEAGARIEVMRVLRNNPYSDKEPTNGR